MKTRQKGNRVQLKLIKEFEGLGYLIGKVEQRGRFVKVKDLYGCFDLVAVRDDIVEFIQVTCNKPHPHKKYIEFSKLYTGAIIVQYCWVDRKGWSVWMYERGKKTKIRG